MVSRKIELKFPEGLHLRPAGRICEKAVSFSSRITIRMGSREYNVKSVISMLSARIVSNTEAELICSGPDEETALEEMARLLEGRNAEEDAL